jgi:hypothetical protein
MEMLAYRGSQCTKFHAVGWMCRFFTSFYLESYSWPDTISRWIGQRNCIKFCVNLGKGATETPWMIRQAFGEESMSRTRKVQTHRDRKKGETGEEQSQGRAHHFLWHQGDWLFTNTSSWQVRQSHSAVTSYSYCVKMCEDIPPNFESRELAVASRQSAVSSHFRFHHGIFDQRQHDCRPPLTLLFPVPDCS